MFNHQQNSDREAKLNEGLLRCGKFQEALSSLMSWIGETEELVSHQKDPSSDYKVVKAQLSEQQLLDRLITDREPSVEALKEMGEQLSRVSEPGDRMRIQQQLNDLESRWLALKDAVRDRRRKLEQTAENAKDFQSQIAPLMEWMDRIEHKLTSVEPISTERGQIQHQIADQQVGYSVFGVVRVLTFWNSNMLLLCTRTLPKLISYACSILHAVIVFIITTVDCVNFNLFNLAKHHIYFYPSSFFCMTLISNHV